jgi:hypothetical protein
MTTLDPAIEITSANGDSSSLRDQRCHTWRDGQHLGRRLVGAFGSSMSLWVPVTRIPRF